MPQLAEIAHYLSKLPCHSPSPALPLPSPPSIVQAVSLLASVDDDLHRPEALPCCASVVVSFIYSIDWLQLPEVQRQQLSRSQFKE